MRLPHSGNRVVVASFVKAVHLMIEKPPRTLIDLQEKIRLHTATVGVVGLGYVGLPFAVEKAKVGYQVIGIEQNPLRAERVNMADNYISDIKDEDLKVIQYTYCHLPIIAPAHLSSSRSHFFYYEPGNKSSIRTALMAAKAYERGNINSDDIYSWDEFVSCLLTAVKL